MEKIILPENKKREIIQSFLITTARYKFSVYEKRILSLIITSLQPQLEGKKLLGKLERDLFGDLRCEFPVKNICEDDTNVVQYIQAFEELIDKKMRYEDENVIKLCTIIQDVEIKKRSGIIKFSICKTMADLFMNFTKGYSKYILEISLKLRSVASARMYELISNQPHPLTYSIDTLKKIFCVEDIYPRTSNFIQRVILPAKKELDEVANWSFDFTPIKKGNKYTHIKLTPYNILHREPEEVQKSDALRKTNLSWFVEKDIRYFLINTCLFSQRELKNNLVTIQKFCNTFADDALNKIMEIWSRSQDKTNPKGYLIKVLQLEVEY